MAFSINEIKAGLTLLIDNIVWQVVEFQHVKPGKGAAFIRIKLRNLKNSNIQERTFRGDDKIEEAFVEERKLQYLYSANDFFYFMDQDNYEEIMLTKDAIGEKVKFLKENSEVTAYFYKNDLLNVNLPNFIEVTINHTEPGIKGDTSKSGTKPAEIETGATILVPLFVNPGDRIKVDTRSGQYIERT